MNRLHPFLRTVASLALIACASVASAQPTVHDGVLTDDKGMSLYWWDNDLTMPGKSVCTGACTLSWPPFLAPEGAKAAGDYSLITRSDGQTQWAYKGKPLYRWVNDKKPGDRTGDGFRGGTWHLAKP